MPKVCLAVFTEQGHKLAVCGETDAEGGFSFQSVPPGRYRLIATAYPLCAANVPLQVVKRLTTKQVRLVHRKPRGLDTCSYGEAVRPKAAPIIAMALSGWWIYGVGDMDQNGVPDLLLRNQQQLSV